mmetsp:Transcript_1625/g.4829  ORF Transcript_1625/g.4829 Transcript_1625/m.4829 type:complete len:435 (+) Transcript_1625:205-1509(+)
MTEKPVVVELSSRRIRFKLKALVTLGKASPADTFRNSRAGVSGKFLFLGLFYETKHLETTNALALGNRTEHSVALDDDLPNSDQFMRNHSPVFAQRLHQGVLDFDLFTSYLSGEKNTFRSATSEVPGSGELFWQNMQQALASPGNSQFICLLLCFITARFSKRLGQNSEAQASRIYGRHQFVRLLWQSIVLHNKTLWSDEQLWNESLCRVYDMLANDVASMSMAVLTPTGSPSVHPRVSIKRNMPPNVNAIPTGTTLRDLCLRLEVLWEDFRIPRRDCDFFEICLGSWNSCTIVACIECLLQCRSRLRAHLKMLNFHRAGLSAAFHGGHFLTPPDGAPLLGSLSTSISIMLDTINNQRKENFHQNMGTDHIRYVLGSITQVILSSLRKTRFLFEVEACYHPTDKDDQSTYKTGQSTYKTDHGCGFETSNDIAAS